MKILRWSVAVFVAVSCLSSSLLAKGPTTRIVIAAPTLAAPVEITDPVLLNKNGVVLITGGRDGAARLASSELYIPRLAYEAGPSANARGGWDRLGPTTYGTYVAAATNSHDHLLISYSGGGRAPSHLLEW